LTAAPPAAVPALAVWARCWRRRRPRRSIRSMSTSARRGWRSMAPALTRCPPPRGTRPVRTAGSTSTPATRRSRFTTTRRGRWCRWLPRRSRGRRTVVMPPRTPPPPTGNSPAAVWKGRAAAVWRGRGW